MASPKTALAVFVAGLTLSTCVGVIKPVYSFNLQPKAPADCYQSESAAIRAGWRRVGPRDTDYVLHLVSEGRALVRRNFKLVCGAKPAEPTQWWWWRV